WWWNRDCCDRDLKVPPFCDLADIVLGRGKQVVATPSRDVRTGVEVRRGGAGLPADARITLCTHHTVHASHCITLCALLMKPPQHDALQPVASENYGT